MKKYLGIDYGSKRVGVAVSDDGCKIAFPKNIIENNKKLPETLKEICKKENITGVVLGESLDSSMEPNLIMEKVYPFKEFLEKELEIPVYFEKEFMTSHHASFGEKRGEFKKDAIDASAAALILQRFLDKINNK